MNSIFAGAIFQARTEVKLLHKNHVPRKDFQGDNAKFRVCRCAAIRHNVGPSAQRAQTVSAKITTGNGYERKLLRDNSPTERDQCIGRSQD